MNEARINDVRIPEARINAAPEDPPLASRAMAGAAAAIDLPANCASSMKTKPSLPSISLRDSQRFL